MRVCITFDMEHDCPPYLTTYRGVEEGTPRLLSLLAEEGVPATFFTTGDVARRYPELMRRIVAEGHELGCHGDSHRRFSAMDRAEAEREIQQASATLRAFYPVVSFRAPNLDLPAAYLPLLRDAGYRIDSSQGRHKQGSYLVRPAVQDGVLRVPASMSPMPLRLGAVVRGALVRLMSDPAVPFYHPWDFIDMTRAPIRLDCRIRSGAPALHHLRGLIRDFRRPSAPAARFAPISELA